jgi:hypothetical protein
VEVESFLPDTLNPRTAIQVWVQTVGAWFLAPVPQPVVRIVALQLETPTRSVPTREARYSLAEAGMTEDDAAAFRARLGGFAEGWDDDPGVPLV